MSERTWTRQRMPVVVVRKSVHKPLTVGQIMSCLKAKTSPKRRTSSEDGSSVPKWLFWFVLLEIPRATERTFYILSEL